MRGAWRSNAARADDGLERLSSRMQVCASVMPIEFVALGNLGQGAVNR